MKKILVLLFFTLIAAASYVYQDHLLSPTKVLPITYTMERPLLDLEEVSSANILFVGDQHASKLSRFKEELIAKTSQNLQSPLKVIDISAPNEGINRTLAKLKQIEKMPDIVIYMGNQAEFYERKFDVRDYDAINRNFLTYQDDKKVSLIMAFPLLSKIFYKPVSLIKLNKEIEKNNFQYPTLFKQKQIELTFKFFELELNEMVKLIKKHKKELILVTTPVNLEIPPQKVCSNATTSSIDFDLDNFEKQLKEGNLKTIIPELQSYAKGALGNARAFYLLGKANLEFSNNRQAINSFKQAASYDCDTSRANPVLNSILKKTASENGLTLLDFAEIVYSQLGRNDLFIDRDFPHDIYYQEINNELGKKIIKLLNL